uniref:Secreted protein n=1 Tax=Steinernema glaseri TaxID=37863 RepID=A0A1I8AF68_9BILA
MFLCSTTWSTLITTRSQSKEHIPAMHFLEAQTLFCRCPSKRLKSDKKDLQPIARPFHFSHFLTSFHVVVLLSQQRLLDGPSPIVFPTVRTLNRSLEPSARRSPPTEVDQLNPKIA